jgi:hypothetical protein
MVEQTLDRDLSEEKNEVNPKNYSKQVLICTFLGIYWVVFFWDIWDRQTHALGFNATVFVFAVLYLLGLGTTEKTLFHRHNLIWALPPFLIALSYSFYENPFFKTISVLAVPLIVAWLYNYAQIPDRAHVWFDRKIMLRLFVRSHFKVPLFIKRAWRLYLHWASVLLRIEKALVRKISLGLLSLAVAGLVIIPLLYTADTLFADRIDSLAQWPVRMLSWTTLYKIYAFIVITIGLFAGILTWEKPWGSLEEKKSRQIDSLISGIMLSGVLALYGLFIFVQIERLWVDDLPVDFASTENLVKTGFWQLVFLSFLNSALFVFFYRKTSSFVQVLLTGFAVSSLLILLSAAQRMWLYVMYYGLSYEKFYSSYVVIFCAVLLAYLTFVSVRRVKTDVLKFVMFAFIWMYTAVALVPAEKIILETNIVLSEREDSRTSLLQVKMLSTDVYSDLDQLVKDCQSGDAEISQEATTLCRHWNLWIAKNNQLTRNKAWHEHNVGTLLVKAQM